MDDLHFKLLDLSAQGYCCSQIMFLMALEMQGKSSPDLVRSVGGLCHGIAFSGNTCGVLTGGACLISYYAGRGSGSEEMKPGCATMLTELAYWFKNDIGSTYGGADCAAILMRSPDRSACRDIVLATYRKILDLLVENGIDPSESSS